MTLDSGTRLGPYEIVAPIGAGGMGEVYKARDTRLERSVAIKILPAEFPEDGQLKARFEREAKTISQLSHPHICTLFDVGEAIVAAGSSPPIEAGGLKAAAPRSTVSYLVMELLDGESLADRLARGPLPLAGVLKFGVQIADALGRAHRAGIVHRDLKPGNVMLTKSGAKLLDFGLAKSSVGGAPPVSAATGLATAARPLTEEGTIVGTFQYMAPEQLEGVEADQRTDIFALGTLLYEMTTGKRAFEGKTRTSLIAAIVSGEPKPIGAIQPLTPPALDHVIRKCLEKDPDGRWQSASDVAEELRWIAQSDAAETKPRVSRWPLAGAVAAALIVGAGIGGYIVARKRPEPRVVYSQINAPEHAAFVFDNSPALLSPDGSRIAFVAKGTEGLPLIWIRPLDSDTALPLKGTEDAAFPFWSPDSKSVAFFAAGKLRRIAAAGGPAETLADASAGRGGSWGTDNVIVFTPTPASALYRVAAMGGEAQAATTLDSTHGTSLRFPAFLPDGHHFLVFVQGLEGHNVLLASLDSKETRPLMRSDVGIVFAPPDFVLFVTNRTLRAQRIDLKAWKLVGDPVSLAEGVQVSSNLNLANVSASNNGLLTYASGAVALSTLRLFSARGQELGIIGAPADQLDPRMAPDGHAVVLTRFDNLSSDIWSLDLRRNVEARLTFSSFNEWAPVWSPDSKSIVYTSFDKSPGDLFLKRVEGSGGGEPFLVDKRRKIATNWSSDGKYIIYHAQTAGSWDIEAYSVLEKKAIPLVHGPAAELNGHLSPNGQWLTYLSDASGKPEVYVQHFPTGAEKWQISGGGGLMPAWSHDGRELYYCTLDGKLMAATVHTEHGLVADAPRLLFDPHIRNVAGMTRNQYDVTADGRFLVDTTASVPGTSASITLVQNWTAKLSH